MVIEQFCIFRTCRLPLCDAAIVKDTIEPVQIGAGLRLHAHCQMGHKTVFSSCEFFNKHRSSVLYVKLSVLQLVIGLNMSQECQS